MRAIRFNKFISEEEKPEWLIEGLLVNTGWTLLVGTEGIGKSTFALQLCLALSNGGLFLERKTKPTRCCYIQADSSTIEWREMVRRIAPNSESYTIIEVEDKCLSNPKYVSDLQFIMNGIQPGFIVFDSLYNLTSESINTEGVLKPIGIMKQLANNNPWMLIHHPTNEENRAAGHHSLRANSSNNWVLNTNRLSIKKGRLCPIKSIDIERDENGLWQLKQVRQNRLRELDLPF